MKKVLVLFLSVVMLLTSIFPASVVAATENNTQTLGVVPKVENVVDSTQDDENTYKTYSQGLEEYGLIEESYDSWYEGMPYYHGEKISSKEISKTIKELEKSIKKSQKTIIISKEDSQSVASFYKAKLNNSKDTRFKTWKNSDLTAPITIYSFDESVYGYMYGIVDKNSKLVGYIVAGADMKAPPILEYSLYPDKFVSFTDKEKMYFGSETGFVYADGGDLYSVIDNVRLSVDKPSDLIEMRSSEDLLEIEEQWISISQLAKEDVPGESVPVVEPSYSTGTQYRLEMDTSDYSWYNVCSYTSMAMYFDALGRRIEPGFLQPGRPHSMRINDYLHNTYGHLPSFDRCASILLSYANSKKLTSNLTFTKHYVSAIGNGGSTNSAVFNKHKQLIQTNMPTLVGYSRAKGTNGANDAGGAHLMMGIGYTSDSFYIVRDTWTYDRTPMRNYYYNKAGYKFCVMGLTYSNSSPSTAWGTQTLYPGDSNYNVKRLKYMLTALYYDPGEISNTYDNVTVNAVKAFQSDYGLTVDGIVGSETYLFLKTAQIMKYDGYAGTWRILNEGKRGDDVAQLQIRLYEMGYNIGASADGIFGAATKAAVQAFQSDNNLTADGIVGSATFTKLYNTSHYQTRYYRRCYTCVPND